MRYTPETLHDPGERGAAFPGRPGGGRGWRHTEAVVRRLIPCVGAVVKDGGGRLLLIKRGHEPGAGLWSLPGGRIEPGETHEQAVAREILEETGLRVECHRLLGTAELPGPDGAVIHVSDYLAVVTGGALAAGDDAADARWVTAADLERLPLTKGLAGYLSAWGAYPA
jgi:8-oxo-dGTP diphosphatase